ncbi:DUF4179 domain-containing protein [Clostridium scatologenes]|uniref:DUF4179 domain-containing protein n=1 Tax=Clostridium scatologenes TaxID=1548 RepID=A0A0E3M9M6_CLOSL|nr:DUF4179 domain-containing protein [Clostridium scatologenes]AKA69772.1 hypothetical protein CSCA_2647 [Clostridium scatologenes]
MENEFDIKLKEYLNKNENIEVPEKISLGVDEVLMNLNNRNKKNNIKKVIVAAVVVIISILGIGSAFPALAEEIPVINKIIGKNSIFNRDYEQFNHFDNLKNIQNNSTNIEQTIKDNNISVTLKEIAYDGAALYIIYEEKGIEVSEKDCFNEKQKLSIDGKPFEAGAIIPEKINNDTVRVTEVYPIVGEKNIPDKFNVEINITQIHGYNGKWNFNLRIDKNQLAKNLNIKKIDKIITVGWDRAKILSLTQTSAYVRLNVEHTHYKPDKYYFSILDDKGNELQGVDMGGITKKGMNKIVTSFFKADKKQKISKIRVIESKIGYFSPNKIKHRSYLELNDTVPKTISIGANKEVKVTKIQEKDNYYEVILQTKDLSIQQYGVFSGGISLYNKGKSESDNEAYSTIKLDELGNNSYKVSVPKKDVKNGKSVLAFGNYDETIKELTEINLK